MTVYRIEYLTTNLKVSGPIRVLLVFLTGNILYLILFLRIVLPSIILY